MPFSRLFIPAGMKIDVVDLNRESDMGYASLHRVDLL